MNTEINLIEKETKPHSVSLFFVSLFFVLLALAVILIVWQRYHLSEQLEAEQQYLQQLESTLISQQESIQNVQKEKQLKEYIDNIQQDRLPFVTLHDEMTAHLESENQLITFSYSEEVGLELDVAFSSIAATSDFVMYLQEKSYVHEVILTNLNQHEANYEVNLIIDLDLNRLKEELTQRD